MVEKKNYAKSLVSVQLLRVPAWRGHDVYTCTCLGV